MNKMKKALLMTLCAACLVVTTVFGTLAYLTDKESVTNTFTVGAVGLTLDEAKVKTDGTYETDSTYRFDENEYHLIPGHTYIKDPTVTVEAGSEDAYVRMIVTVENIDQLKRALPKSEIVTGNDGNETTVVFQENEKFYGEDGTTFLLQMLCSDWDPDIWRYEKYTESTNGEDCNGYYEFRYVGNDLENRENGIVVKSTDETKLDALFQTITVPGEIDNEHLAYLEDVKIVVSAHAIQADGFKNEGEAWEAFSK